MSTLTSYEGSNDDYENTGTGDYRSQGFKIPSNATITGVSFYGSKGNSSSGTTFTVEIRSGASPSATLVRSESFNISSLTSYGSPAWNDLTFVSSFAGTAGTQYYFTIKPTSGSASDEIRWSKDTTSPSYPDGSAWKFSAGSWTAQTGSDENFRIYGTTGGGSNPPKIIII